MTVKKITKFRCMTIIRVQARDFTELVIVGNILVSQNEVM